MMKNNFICQHSSEFAVNSEFHLLFKYNIIPCTIDYMSSNLVALEDGPIKIPPPPKKKMKILSLAIRFNKTDT